MIPPGAPIVTAAAIRAAEEAAFAAGLDPAAAMERAGIAVAREARRFAGGAPILMLAGPGNNGGDGYVAARILADWGHDVIVAASAPPRSDLAIRAAAAWTGETATLADAPARPLVVDALFGTGLSRPLDEGMTGTLRRLRDGGRLLAVDVPSDGAADVTLALGALKPVHVLSPDCGAVLLADIGVAVASDWATIARPFINAPYATDHKYRATVAILAGTMPGAARLAARGAAGAGAGYVILAGAVPPLDGIVRRDDVAATLADERVGALLVGPGLGRDDAAKALLDRAIDSARDLVIDGDALSLLGEGAAARLRGRAAATILTPHDGEFARMFGTDDDRIAATVAAAQASGATVVRKGHATVIADPAGRAIVSTGGSSWLATAGTGDVLAGAVAARHAAGCDAAQAVWLHAAASQLAGAALTADDLATHLPGAVAQCR